MNNNKSALINWDRPDMRNNKMLICNKKHLTIHHPVIQLAKNHLPIYIYIYIIRNNTTMQQGAHFTTDINI